MNIQQMIAISFVPLLSPLISAGILVIAYLNWNVRTIKLRFCKTCQWRDTSVNPAGTVNIMISLENCGDESFKILKTSCLHFSTDSRVLPKIDVPEVEPEHYGRGSFNVYSIPLIPDGITTYIIAINVVYKSLEGFLGSERLPFGVKSKLFLFECSPGYISQIRSFENQDQPFLNEIVEKSKRHAAIDLLPQGFS